MKLRWVEREIEVVTTAIGGGCYTQTERFLQYWLPQDEWSVNGEWVDVPLGFEELDK